jgi:DNA polymerase-4
MDSIKKHTRKIIHIDMDAFYASVEQRDFPEYRGKPLVVGGKPESRGVVATASYEAREYKIKSAMPCQTAYKLCPQAIFVYPRFDAYKEVSRQIREIFSRYTDLIEPLSLDEAYLDVTEDKLGIGSAMDIALAIKKAIKDELNLTASAGVSVNKFVAKIASDMNKPDGLTFIGPSKVSRFIDKLPVEKFHGIGKVTAARMRGMQLYTGADLKKLTEQQLVLKFGKSGKFYYKVVNGLDDRPVQPHRESKSVGAENTFDQDTNDVEFLNGEIRLLSNTVANRLQKHQLNGKTITLKIKFADFKQITRSVSLRHYTADVEELYQTAVALLKEINLDEVKIRLIGVTLSNFEKPAEENIQVDTQLLLDL